MKALGLVVVMGVCGCWLAGCGGSEAAWSEPARAEEPPPRAAPETSPVDTLAAELIAGEWTAAMVVGVLSDGERSFRSYGMLDGSAPDETTLFEIGSVTKTFTGLLLADETLRSELTLETSVGELLPDASLADGVGQITLAELSTHRSGLPRLPSNFTPADPQNPYADYTEDLLFGALETVELTPNPEYAYSNLGVGLLGTLISRQAETSYEALLRDRVFGPLAMNDSTVTLTDAQRSRLAPGRDSELRPAPPWDFQALAGAGAIRSSARDMLRYVEAYLTGEPASLHEALAVSVRPQAESPGLRLGLGWHISGDPETVWHNGETGGYHSFVAFTPSRNVGVVVLSAGATSVVDGFGDAVLRDALGLPQTFELPETVAVAEATLERYVGQYRLAPEVTMTITREDDRLYLQVTGQPRFRLYGKSDTEFYVRVVEASGTFVGDGPRADRLIWRQGGRDIEAPRIEEEASESSAPK
ncbi:MAG: serine hydrolase [Myxococcota bacterium]